MAAPGGKYFVQDNLATTLPHHDSFEQLWETKWKKPCAMGVYPFMFAAIQDFEPIVQQLVKEGQKEPFDWDAYARTFAPKAEELASRAATAEAAGNLEEASELYLRASAVYRISRFPAPRSPLQHVAWNKGKALALRGFQLSQHPINEIHVPHTHRLPDEGPTIPIYHHLPPSATASTPVPCIIILTGLDGYRTELAVWTPGFSALGIATIILEIPGTGDCPAAASDPTSPDRLYSSLLAWIAASQPCIDPARLVAWGFSTGGFYALRLAHTHPAALAGAVALGGGAHHMFDAAWLDAAQRREYPFDLGTTLAHKFGYADFERFKVEARGRFSLVEDGTLDAKGGCARLLLVNGTEDEIFPVDDYYVALGRGAVKEVRLVPGVKHMGEPESFGIILRWMYALLGVRGDVGAQLRTLPFKARFP